MVDEWESVLDRWSAELDQEGWVTLAEAQAATGVSRSGLRSWYRKGELASRLRDGPHGPERLVQLDAVVERVARSSRRIKPLPAQNGAAPQDAAGGEGQTVSALVELLAAQIERAERRAERAEAALRDALVRASAAEAERDELRRRSAR